MKWKWPFKRQEEPEYLPIYEWNSARFVLEEGLYHGWDRIDDFQRTAILKKSIYNSLQILRKYWERENIFVPESCSMELKFAVVHFHNLRQDISPVMGYLAAWMEDISWNRNSIRSFLTDWLRGPVPATVSFTFNHTQSNTRSGDYGLASEYSSGTMLASIEYILDDLGLE